MSTLKILLIGIFAVVAVMIITAAIHMIAPYVAALVVGGAILWLVIKTLPPDGKDNQR